MTDLEGDVPILTPERPDLTTEQEIAKHRDSIFEEIFYARAIPDSDPHQKLKAAIHASRYGVGSPASANDAYHGLNLSYLADLAERHDLNRKD